MNIKPLPAKLLLLFSATSLLILGACGTIKTTQQPVIVPITTEAQAISVAASYIPSLIFTKARVVASKAYIGSSTGFYWQWDVQLYDISVTKAELGWKLDSKTVLGPDEPYTAIEIKLNASTGELVSKQAEIPQVW